MIELGLQRTQSLARQVELFARALDLHLQARDALLQFHRLGKLQFAG